MGARRSTTITLVALLLLSLAVVSDVVLRKQCPDGRPDGPSARAAAAACGGPVEVALLTSATRLVVANADGTMTVTQHAAPQRVRTDNGWTPVDTTIDAQTSAPKAAAVDLRVAGGGNEPLATLKKDDKVLEWGLAPQDAPRLEGDTATYPDVRVQALSDGFRLTLTGKGAQQVRMPVNTRGLALQENEGTIRALDAKHRTVFVAEPATIKSDKVPTKIENGAVVFTLPDGAWELTQRVRTGEPTWDNTLFAGQSIKEAHLGDENVSTLVKTAAAQQRQHLTLDDETQVLVTTYTPRSNALPTVTSTDYPADDKAHGAPKQAGKFTLNAPGAAEFRYRWQGEPSFHRAKTENGSLQLSLAPPAKGTQVLEVKAVDGAGQESDLALHATRVAPLAKPVVKHDNGVFSAENGTAFKYRWNDEWIVEKAKDGKANLTLVPRTATTVEVRAVNGDQESESTTFSTAAAGTPLVSSADYPADGAEHGAPGKEGTFTFRATGTDPIAKFRYQLDDGATTDVAGSAKAQAKITPPTAGEHVLTVKAVTASGDESAPTQHRFKVAPAAPKPPNAPEVNSTDYPADGQPHGAPGQAGTFTLKSQGANGFRYRLGNGPTTTVAASGETQVQLTPSTSGTHTVTAWALNGQTSAAATYTFVVGGLPVPSPDAPLVSSTDYPADGQPHGSIGQAGKITVRPQGAVEANVVVYQLDTDAASKEQAVANGAAELSVTPVRSGRRTLTVWSKVTATGALSSPVKYEFVAGAPAGPRDFFYDAAGQLAGVANSSGEAAAYRYDDNGNLEATERFVQGDATVFAIVPARGPVGSSVEISGFGFAQQGTTVTFDGIAAQVTAASANRLTVTVPQGTHAGAVRVSANGKTVSSPRPFQIARGVTAPAIAATSTDRGDPGDVVTITGTGFDPDKARNVVRFHQTVARVREATPTKLVVEVPDAASSGRITVRTPGGETTTAADFLVAPRGFVTSKLVYGGRLQLGAALNLDIPAGKSAVVLVDGKIGEKLNLKLENNTIPVRSAMWMFTPHGGDFARRALGDPLDLWAGSKLHQDLPTFNHNGTYTIVVAPDDAHAGKVSVTLSRDLTGDKLTRDGSGVPFSIKQNVPAPEMPFTATAGEWMSFGLTDISEPGNHFNVTVVDPDGGRLVWRARLGDYVPTMVFQAKKTGTYKVIPNFDPGQLGFGKVWLSSVIDVGALAVNGNPTAYQVLRPGQSVRMQFNGIANQPLVLGHTDNTMRESGRPGYPVSIMTEPDGVQVELRDGTADTRNLRIRKTGQHNLFISGWEAVGTAKAWLSTVAEGGKLPVNASTKIVIDRPGREMWLDYDGVQGKPLTMLVRKSVPGQVTIRVFRPNGTTQVVSSVDGKIDIPSLPETGKYRIFVDPAYAVTGDMTFNVSEPADIGTIPLDAPPTNLTVSVPGQKITGKITGQQGQRLSIGTASQQVPFLKWKVTKPDGSTLDTTGNSAYPTSLGWDITQFPVAGDYRVTIEPVNQDVEPTSGTVTVWLSSEADGGKIEYGGAAKTVTFSRPSQNGKLTFDGTLNDLPKLSIKRNIGDNGTYYTLYAPNGTVETPRRFVSSEPYEFFTRLKATGTYTLVFDPANSVTGSIDVSITKRATAAPVTEIKQPTVATPTCRPAEPAPPKAPLGRAPEGTDQPKHEEPETAAASSCEASPWRPDAANLNGRDWTTRYEPRPVRERALQFAFGFTGVVGTVQSTDGKPLRDVTVSTGGKKAVTDDQGRFTLAGLTEGHVSLRVDGRTTGRPFGTFDIGVDVKHGQVLVLPYTVFLPEIDRSTVVRVPSPTVNETVLTTKSIPGLEVRIPAGTVIRDADGNVASELSLTPIPIDRPPFPLPPTKVPVYFTVQPGGGYLFPQGATIVYPNYTKEPPGTRTQFWNYDPEGKGWHIYGHGTVTKDGAQIVPDADVKFYRLTGAMTVVPGLNPAGKAPKPNGERMGDPVDPATGLLVDEQVDMVVGDIQPIEVKRTYQQGDTDIRAFGVGTNFDYGIFPWAPTTNGVPTFKEFDLVQPDGSKIHYTRTTPGQDYAGAVFQADPTPTKFDGSVAVWNDAGWDVKLRDGTVMVIGEEAPMQEIRDKYGNAMTITRAPAPPGVDGKVRANGPVRQVTSSTGRWVRFNYDESNPPRVRSVEDNLGRRVSYTYFPTGHLETVTDVEGGVTRYTWDAKGLLKTITDARNIQYLVNEYDDKGRVKTQTARDGGVTKFDYTDVNGVITETRMTDPRNAVHRLVFNDKGQVVSKTKAFGTEFAQETTIEYEPNGVRVKSKIDALKRKTSYVYDAKGFISQITVLDGTANARTEKWEHKGPNGELTKHTDDYNKDTVYELDPRGAVKSVTDAAGRKTLYDANEKGLVTKVTDPAGKFSTVDYHGVDPVRTTDPLGKSSTVGYDAIGRKVLTTNPLGVTTETVYTPADQVAASTDGLGRTTSYEYDRNGNRTKVIDPKGGTTVFDYNEMEKLRSVTDALGVSWAAEAKYDFNGNLERMTNRRGVVVEHKYDPLNRRYETKYGTESTVTYGYDAGDRMRSTVDSAAGNTTTDYDDVDRVKQEVSPHGTVSYSYGAATRDRTTTVAGRTPTKHVYDGMGALGEIQQGGVQVSVVSRDRVGRPERVGAPGTGIGSTYTYDDIGNVKSITYKVGATTVGGLAYDYDAARQPVRSTGTWSRTMLPEPFGPAVYDRANRVKSIGGKEITYDLDGNLTSDGVHTYTWNARGQLATVTTAGMSASFGYLADGRRHGRTVNGATTNYLYDGANPLQEKVNGQVAATMTSDRADEFHLRDAGGTTRRYLTDRIGSTVGLVDGTGTGAAYTYEPFGRTYSAGNDQGNSFRFTGREDDGTGLYYYRARYYSPVLQRFLSEDPVGFDGGVNLHAYVGNAPTKRTDPTGLKPPGSGNNGGGTGNDDYIPGQFLADKAFKAPKQTTPGTRVLEGEYINDRGPGGIRVEPWKAYYDQYGRLVARTDYNAGVPSQNIPNVHHSEWVYGRGTAGGREINKHTPGEFRP